MKHLKWLALLLLLAPIAFFTIFKPGRVLIPELFGVSCYENNICIDDPEKLDMALTLYNSSRKYLNEEWNLVTGSAKIIFCHTEKCKNLFGLSRKAGYTLGNLAIVIAPRGWKEHYIAHELIHYWQADNFGSLTLVTSDKWVTEGMAYALSNDPRETLEEPYELYRLKFQAWHQKNIHSSLADSLKLLL